MKHRGVSPFPIVCRLCLVSFALWLPGCAENGPSDRGSETGTDAQAERSAESEAELPESAQLLRGHLVIGHEVRSFTSCDSGQDLWVTDETGGELARVYEELTSGVYQRLYAVVLGQVGLAPPEGFGADYDGSITVTSLRHAAPESHACDEDLSGIVMRAFGNEPFWRVDIRNEGILLSELGAEDRLFASASVDTRGDGMQRFRGTSEPAPGPAASVAIDVVIEERHCRDSMSGAYFSFAARVEVDGRELGGCARQGW